LSFFDEGDEPRTAIRSPKPPPRRPTARPRRAPADDRTLLLRRGGAAAIVLLVLIGIVLAVKAVLNNQALQSLKTYNSNVSALVSSELTTIRDPFFHELDGAFSSPNPAEVPTTLQQYVSLEAGNYHQAEGWSVPSQMVGAQTYFVEALGLRYEALQDIETEMTQALGQSGGQKAAIYQIAGDMEKLSAADVLFADRVKPLIQEALATAGINGESTPDSEFLPDIGWLQPQNVAERILGFVPASLGGTPGSGSPGHALESVSVQTSTSGNSTPLNTTGTINTFPYTAAGITFVLNVLNSGTVTEYGVQTTLRFKKTGVDTSCLDSDGQIPKTVPGNYYNSSIVFAPSPSCIARFYDVPLEMKAGVTPLPGETESSNNFQSFLVEFTH
jgi:hypothetical protein